MIPASSNRAGWSLFQREMRDFFTGAKPVSMDGASSTNGGGGGGQSVGGDRSGKILSAVGHQRKSRILKNLELTWGRKGFLEAMQRMV